MLTDGSKIVFFTLTRIFLIHKNVSVRIHIDYKNSPFM